MLVIESHPMKMFSGRIFDIKIFDISILGIQISIILFLYIFQLEISTHSMISRGSTFHGRNLAKHYEKLRTIIDKYCLVNLIHIFGTQDGKY